MKRTIRKIITAALLTASFSFLWAEENFFSDLFLEDFPAVGASFTSDPVVAGAVLLGLGVSGYVLMKNDLYFSDEIRSRRGETGDAVFGFFNEAGDGVNILAGCGVLYSIGGEKEKKAAYDAVRALAAAGIISTALKTIIGRDRPSAGSGPYMYRPFSSFDDSMPSGHTVAAFAWASVIAESYSAETCGISYLAYAAAAATGFARIYFGKHWPSDILAGAAIGILAGKAVMASSEKSGAGLTVTPAGINFSAVF